jgi:iron complex outermembrane receptor protein
VLTSAAGAPLPDISQGGTVVIGENDVETIAANGRGFALQSSDSQPIFDHGNQFSAGASLDFAIVEFDSAAQVGAINSQLLVLPSNLIVDTPEAAQNAALAAGDPDVTAQPVALHSTNRVYGLYATDTFDVAPTVSLTASARYNIAFIDLQDDLGANLTGNNRYSHFNPAFGGTYRVVPTVTAYAGFSENTRTPTASEIECSNPLQPCLLPSNLAGDPPTLRQVVAHTTELGVRGNAPDAAGSGRITWNASIFRTRLYDDIYGIATSVSEGFFQNIGQTRRQGLEAGVQYQAPRWATFLNYSDVDATFQSPLTLPSPSSPFQDANGNIQVLPGDHLPGIPRHRLKAGVDCMVLAGWTVGGTVKFVGSSYYYGDESNQLAPLPSYRVVELHTSYRPGKTFEFFASVNNLLNARYANYGILSDPTGVGAPGIPANGVTNGPGVDNRFQSPAAPIAVTAGVRIGF